MLTAVYGSSEYAQALSRTGSIYGNIFIVNKDVNITDVQFAEDSGDFQDISFKFNKTPLGCSKGLIVGPDYHNFMLKRLNITPEFQTKKCVRATLITRKAFLNQVEEKVATFVYPPYNFGDE